MFKTILKCTQYDLMRAKAKSGQMYFATDSRTLYKDNGNNVEQRLRFNAVILNNENERLRHIKPIIGKFYYVEETNSLWLFDTRWVLKIGNDVEYNAYYADDYISPIINTDNYISGANGDKIIDNNGLLGNGSVVIRDANRINRGIFYSNTSHNQLEIRSYLDDGFLFIPNSHLPYNDLSTSLGALHLTVDRKDNNSTGLDLNGCAHYHGTWNNYGEMYLIQNDNDSITHPDYVPINDYEIVKFYINCTKQDDLSKITTHIIIRPISDSLAIVHILSIKDEDSKSVVRNDMGELIFTSSGDVINDVTCECKRKITNNGSYRISQYMIDSFDEIITIKQNKNSTNIEVDIGKTWTDEPSSIDISVKRWIKDKVLTISELEKEIRKLKEEINKLKK